MIAPRPQDRGGTVWRYMFTIQPGDGLPVSAAAHELLQLALGRVEVAATEGEFNHLRAEFGWMGFEFLEIERVPYVVPEPVM